MTPEADRSRTRGAALGRAGLPGPVGRLLLLLGALATVPTFASSPGLMPADSKLYLYLDPGRLISDGVFSFDPRQFAGWVPHQHIAFVWPSGPWFWAAERLGLPDWVAHRAWVAALLLLAGAGVARSARLLGLGWTGAAIAAVVYQLSPYTIAYLSRTSVMLLPWAALGWILAATILASRQPGWRFPTRVGLIVLCAGAVNPTALAMVAPVPVLWLLHARGLGLLSGRAAVGVAARIGIASLALSAWWIAMVITQSRAGAAVLRYSETLADVSAAASAPEVLRGLGYWLFYVRDTLGPATSAAGHHMGSLLVIAASMALPILGFWAIAATRWVHRRFVIGLVVLGTVLAVGVHPIEGPSPLMALVVDSDAALALRSSTRAVPMIALGLALILGARLGVIGTAGAPTLRRSGRPWPQVALGVVVLLALVNQPALWGRGVVDPLLRRSADPPAAWIEGAAAVDSRARGYRLLQIPGAEFGSFRWGHTIDQPLVALTDRPLVTRDLLPLGSEPAMDLLYALDDRLQFGTLPEGALAVVARLFGADLIWLTNDLAHERYLTVRPETLIAPLAAADDLEVWAEFGAPAAASGERLDVIALSDPAVGVPVAPVMLWEVTDPVPVLRARTRTVALVGSGDGIIDAAAAGLLSGHELILPATSATEEELRAAAALVITDSPRARPRHWRSSQDTLGATESRDPALWPLARTAGDARLHSGPSPWVTAEQRGPVRATASGYGEPFAYLPEMRPVMAIDGDPTTAWQVGGGSDPRGERLRLFFDQPPSNLQLLQPPGGRWIEEVGVEVTVADGSVHSEVVGLDHRSRLAPGQAVDLAALLPDHPPPGPVMIELVITAVSAGPLDPVGFAEVGGPTATEVLVVPEAPPHHHPVLVLTRERVDPRLAHRSDPEPLLRREVHLPALGPGVTWALDARVSLDARSPDTVLAVHLPTAAVATSRLLGVIEARGHSAVDGDPTTAWISAIDGGLGARLSITHLDAPTDRVRITERVGPYSPITEVTLRGRDHTGAEVTHRVTVDRVNVDAVNVDAVEIDLPSPLGPGPVEIEITGISPLAQRDPRTGRTLTAPVAISEIDPGVAMRTVIPPAHLECVTDLLQIDGRPVGLRIDPAAGTAVVCGAAVDTSAVTPGETVLLSGEASRQAPGFRVDRVRLAPTAPTAEATAGHVTDPARLEVLASGRLHRRVAVQGCAEGCWVVLGEGYSPAWSARVEGVDLGPPRLVDGLANGWYLPPGPDGREVQIRWTAQRPLTAGFALSAVALVLCGWWARPRRAARRAVSVEPPWPAPAIHPLGAPPHLQPPIARTVWARLVAGALWVAAAAALVGWWWAVPAAALAVAMVWGVTARLPELVAAAGVTLGYGLTAVLWFRRSPAPDLGWPAAIADAHGLMMFSVIALVAALWQGGRE